MEPQKHNDYEDTFRRVATILDVIAGEQAALQKTLADYIAHAQIRDAETTDKLNGLIDLMNRHITEGHH